MLNKYLIYTPGPVDMAEAVCTAIVSDDICDREPAFDALHGTIEQKLIFSSVMGNGAILIRASGEFGGQLHTAMIIKNKRTPLVEVLLGLPFYVTQSAACPAHAKIDAFAMVQHGTCSGGLNPPSEIGVLTKQVVAIFMVNGVGCVAAEVIDAKCCNIPSVSSPGTKSLGSYPQFSFIFGRKQDFERLNRHAAKSTGVNLATFYALFKNDNQTRNASTVAPFSALGHAIPGVLREKSIIVDEGYASKVGNTGKLSAFGIWYFPTTFKDVLLILQAKAAELVRLVTPTAAPLAIVINHGAVNVALIAPIPITATSCGIAVICSITGGGTAFFIVATVLIHASHIFDCMDNPIARHRPVSSPQGSYHARKTDQVHVTLWLGTSGYAAFAKSSSGVPDVIAFFSLRGGGRSIREAQ